MTKHWKLLLAIFVLGVGTTFFLNQKSISFDFDFSFSMKDQALDQVWWDNLDEHWQAYFMEKHEVSQNPTEADFKKLNQLETLDLNGLTLKTFEPIVEMQNVRIIWCQDQESLPSLKPFEKMDKLEELSFGGCKIDDLTPFAQLSNLKKLELFNTEISDIEVVANFKDLEVLDISSTKVSDISALQGLGELQILYINSTNITSLEPVKGMQLTELSFIGAEIEDLSPLQDMRNLNQLVLLNSEVASLKPIYSLHALAMLYCGDDSKIPSEQIEEFKELHTTCEVF